MKKDILVKAISMCDAKAGMTVEVVATSWKTGKTRTFYEDVQTTVLPVAQRMIEKRYPEMKIKSVTKAR